MNRLHSVRVLLVGSLLVGFAAGSRATRAGALGLVPDPDPQRQERAERVVRLAAEPELRVVVGRGSGHWEGMTEVIRRLLDDESVDVLLAPPDRAIAHLVTQIATKRHVPAIELSSRGSETATTATTAGSFWLVTCRSPLESPPELRRKLGRAPDETEIAAWTAVAAARALLGQERFRAGHAESSWRDLLPPSCRDPSIPEAP